MITFPHLIALLFVLLSLLYYRLILRDSVLFHPRLKCHHEESEGVDENTGTAFSAISAIDREEIAIVRKVAARFNSIPYLHSLFAKLTIPLLTLYILGERDLLRKCYF